MAEEAYDLRKAGADESSSSEERIDFRGPS
jgi:hypothetical protein